MRRQKTLKLASEPTSLVLDIPTADGGVCLTDFIGDAPFVIADVTFSS